jgi:hypothetical protein
MLSFDIISLKLVITVQYIAQRTLLCTIDFLSTNIVHIILRKNYNRRETPFVHLYNTVDLHRFTVAR